MLTKIISTTIIVFCALVLLPWHPGQKVLAVDTGYPTGQVLLDYALKKNNPIANPTVTAKLKSALEAHVNDYISQPKWAAYNEWFGIDIHPNVISLTEPTETLYGLSLSYPYINDGLKTQVRTYLRNQWSTYLPYQNLDYPNVKEGTRRNWNPVDPAEMARATNPISGRIIQLYPIYLFAQNTNSWDLVQAQYNTIKTIFNQIPTSLASRDNHNNSRNIASVIGFIRIADKFGNSTDVNAGVSKLTTLIKDKIDHQRSEGADCTATINSANSGQERSLGCLYVGGTHNSRIEMFTGSVPELGRMLRDYATTGSNQLAKWVARNAQGYWLVNGDTPVQEGEVNKPYYWTTMAYFHLMSDVQAMDFDHHLQLADMPASRADAYYLERVVRAIEASGNQSWQKYDVAMQGFGSGSSTSSTSSSLAACPTDINGDRFRDISDYSILAANFLSTSPSNPRADINADGIVDISDYGLLVRDFFLPCP